MIEVELKLQLSEVDAQKIHSLDWLIDCTQETQSRHLYSVYYDTKDTILKNNGVAVRLRQDGSDVVQTLKHESKVEDGLSRRKEFEWMLDQKHIDYSLLEKEIPNLFNEINQKLKPLFLTEFIRNTWLVADEAGNLVEIALDQGEIRCDELSEEILELELELKKGDEKAIFTLMDNLKKHLTLTPYNPSKSCRGYRLFEENAGG